MHEKLPVSRNASRREVPYVVAKLQAAHDKAIDFIRNRPAEARKYLAKYLQVTPRTAQAAGIGLQLKSSEPRDASAAQAYADLLYSQGALARPVNASRLYG